MAEESNHNNLEDRIVWLERKVERLERALSELGVDYGYEDEIDRKSRHDEEPEVLFEENIQSEKRKEWIPEDNSFGENWLNWIGIGLLLLGVVFLFKYSIDQGWLIPPVRSAFGLTIGLTLLVSGFKLDESNETFRQIMLGGGIAAFYITGFATFQLYGFMTYAFVWGFMIIVTLLALSLALQQNEPILSVLGTIGGLGTPFMLYQGEGSLTMLILYTCLILAGSGAIYFFKGWKSLLWTMVAGGWLVLTVGWFNNIYSPLNPSLSDQWTLQWGVIFVAVTFWLVPVIREILSYRNPEQWPDPAFMNKDQQVEENTFFVANPSVQILAVIIPVATLFYSFWIWSISNEMWGAIVLVCALPLGYTYLPLRKEGLERLSMVHGFAALILLTVSLFLLLEGEILLIALAMEGLVLRIIAAKTGETTISMSSHLLFIVVGFWLFDRFLNLPGQDLLFVNLDALTEVFIIGVAGLAIPGYIRDKNIQLIYRGAAHVGMLAWFLQELVILDNGQAFVTVSWGVYALLILFVGFWKNIVPLRFIGMATIFLVVAKLFLVDLTQIQTLLRILLFIGFGALFLAVGYYFQTRWGDMFVDSQPKPESEDEVFVQDE